MAATTLYEKIWAAHLLREETTDAPALIYVDRHLIHEGSSPQAFAELRRRGLPVRRPDLTFATADHVTPTRGSHAGGKLEFIDDRSAHQVRQLEESCREWGIRYFPPGAPGHGIVHVTGPELGLTLPGTVIVCGDSHTSTHGAFGALAFGIGTTEVGHVLATQSLLQRKSRSKAVEIGGRLAPGVAAKDLALAVISKVGVDWGRESVVEYRGSAISALSMEERMTICNMSIEAGARAGLIAPDETTARYLAGRRFAPSGAAWDRCLAGWKDLVSDEDAAFSDRVSFDASSIGPMITYGTNPGMAMPIDGVVPDGGVHRRALEYMRFASGQRLLETRVSVVFIGSCTNGRLSDLREAAAVMKGRRVAEGTRVLVVPGSYEVKRQAEGEGLADVFREAGAEWREPGCSMCIALNGDLVGEAELAVSTSNRNFEGRQGRGSRTILSSPATAAAAAVTGRITDPRTLLEKLRATA